MRGGLLALAQQCRAAGRRAFSGPSVLDKIVTISVADTKGRRHPMKGLEGTVLVDLIADHPVLGTDEYVGLSPDGRGKRESLITIPSDFLEAVPPLTQEDRRALAEIAPTTSSHSYLASKVTLSKRLEGMTFAVSPLQPWKTL